MSQAMLFHEPARPPLDLSPHRLTIIIAGGDRAFVAPAARFPGYFFVTAWLAATDAPRTRRELGREAVTAIGLRRPVSGPRVREVLEAIAPGFGGGQAWDVSSLPSEPWTCNRMLGEST